MSGLLSRMIARREAGLKRLFGNQLWGPTDPARDASWGDAPARKGFFTDTSICIGCKACEVACKEWNHVPQRPERGFTGDSYDNTGHLGPDAWRHVAFIEQGPEQLAKARESGRRLLTITPVARETSTFAAPVGENGPQKGPGEALALSFGTSEAEPSTPVDRAVRWLMSSDVCKHCTHAACLDVCPTGALFRSEFGTVVVQDDVCNGCGYCVAACPFGVIGRREGGLVQVGGASQPVHNGGIAQKCTLCYDRISAGMEPACAKTCPTTSITFGDHDDLVVKARERLAQLHAEGHVEARLYGANPDDGVGGTGSIFLLLDEPEAYGLPPDPVVTTRDLPHMFTHAGAAGTVMIAVVAAVFAVGGRRR